MSHQFTGIEKTVCASLTLLYVIRMLGLFIVLPLFSLYEKELIGATPFLMGLAFSSYAITQMLLQPIFGYASDQYGRKPVIIFGLLLFILGSLVIAFTNNIYMVLLGRIIQGSGAISAAILALATDLTREKIRTKVMAIIGVSIGITFGLAMFIGPILQGLIGMQGIFIICAALGILGILLTFFVLPTPNNLLIKDKDKNISVLSENNPENNPENKPNKISFYNIKSAIVDSNLWRLYIGAMSLHLLLTMAFMVIPSGLNQLGIKLSEHWQIYVPCFFISIVIMGAAVGICEKRAKLKSLFLSAIFTIIMAFAVFAMADSWLVMSIAMTLFFIGFNIMEATQPSLMARFAPDEIRGTAMGIFSSMQFLGASLGGILGASLLGYVGLNAVYLMAAALAILWGILALGMENPKRRIH